MSKPKTKPKTVRVRVSYELAISFTPKQYEGFVRDWMEGCDIQRLRVERVPEKRDSGSADRNHAG